MRNFKIATVTLATLAAVATVLAVVWVAGNDAGAARTQAAVYPAMREAFAAQDAAKQELVAAKLRQDATKRDLAEADLRLALAAAAIRRQREFDDRAASAAVAAGAALAATLRGDRTAASYELNQADVSAVQAQRLAADMPDGPQRQESLDRARRLDAGVTAVRKLFVALEPRKPAEPAAAGAGLQPPPHLPDLN